MAYSKEQVIEMCKKIHGDKYDYSITEGVQNKLGKIKYICPIHGMREQMFQDIMERNKRVMQQIEEPEYAEEGGLFYYNSEHPIISLFASWFANWK